MKTYTQASLFAVAAVGFFGCALMNPKPAAPVASTPASASASAAAAPAPSSTPASAAAPAAKPVEGSAAIQPESKPSVEPVTIVSKDKVKTTWVKGGALYQLDNFKIMAGLKEPGAKAEVHVQDADIFYITDGKATFVTGGELVDAANESPDEIRGASIKDGESHVVQKGDVVVVPHGTPHWFSKVSKPFRFFVVKVR